MWKEEKLYSREQFFHMGKQPPEAMENVLIGYKGEATFHRESSCPGYQMVHFYENEESKFTHSDWSR